MEEEGLGTLDLLMDLEAMGRAATCHPAGLNEDFRVDSSDLQQADEALETIPGPSALIAEER